MEDWQNKIEKLMCGFSGANSDKTQKTIKNKLDILLYLYQSKTNGSNLEDLKANIPRIQHMQNKSVGDYISGFQANGIVEQKNNQFMLRSEIESFMSILFTPPIPEEDPSEYLKSVKEVITKSPQLLNKKKLGYYYFCDGLATLLEPWVNGWGGDFINKNAIIDGAFRLGDNDFVFPDIGFETKILNPDTRANSIIMLSNLYTFLEQNNKDDDLLRKISNLLVTNLEDMGNYYYNGTFMLKDGDGRAFLQGMGVTALQYLPDKFKNKNPTLNLKGSVKVMKKMQNPDGGFGARYRDDKQEGIVYDSTPAFTAIGVSSLLNIPGCENTVQKGIKSLSQFSIEQMNDDEYNKEGFDRQSRVTEYAFYPGLALSLAAISESFAANHFTIDPKIEKKLKSILAVGYKKLLDSRITKGKYQGLWQDRKGSSPTSYTFTGCRALILRINYLLKDYENIQRETGKVIT